MSYYKFEPADMFTTFIEARPRVQVTNQGGAITGSIQIERPFLTDPLANRLIHGYSQKMGGFTDKFHPLTGSIELLDAEQGADNRQVYSSIRMLMDRYPEYTSGFRTGSIEYDRMRVITIPQMYYERGIVPGSFTASDLDSAGDARVLHDNGRGGIFSGSLSASLVGNIFYSEGIVALYAGGLNDAAGSNDFGEASPSAFKWQVNFRGQHKIPVKIFKCRAPAGELNASTNPTFSHILTGSNDMYRNELQCALSQSLAYVSAIGLYDEQFELVAVAKLAQPIRKDEAADVLFRLRLDF